MKITFELPNVQGKERPRHSRFGVYTPTKTKHYENMIMTKYKLAGGIYHDVPAALKVTIQCFYRVPKNTSKSVKEKAITNELKHIKHKSDIDNVAKAVLDGLNKVAYKDDCQVAELEITKQYATDEKLIVTVEPIGVGLR